MPKWIPFRKWWTFPFLVLLGNDIWSQLQLDGDPGLHATSDERSDEHADEDSDGHADEHADRHADRHADEHSD